MLIWALVSLECRETIELYFNENDAAAALEEVLEDEPEWREQRLSYGSTSAAPGCRAD